MKHVSLSPFSLSSSAAVGLLQGLLQQEASPQAAATLPRIQLEKADIYPAEFRMLINHVCLKACWLILPVLRSSDGKNKLRLRGVSQTKVGVPHKVLIPGVRQEWRNRPTEVLSNVVCLSQTNNLIVPQLSE